MSDTPAGNNDIWDDYEVWEGSGLDEDSHSGPGGPGRVATRLVQDDAGIVDIDDTAEEVATGVEDTADLSPEEAAIRIEEDPSDLGLGGGSPGYLDDEGPD